MLCFSGTKKNTIRKVGKVCMWRLGSARISNEKVWFNMCKCIAAKNSWTWGNNDDQ